MKKAIALLMLLLPVLGISQITFQPGYFIERGIKKECLIKNIAWKNNPVSIEYKFSENEESAVKTIDQISEFSVNNTYKFIRFTVNIDRSPVELRQLSYTKEPDWQTETVFLKVLVEGKVTLYQYEDGNLIKYFFSKDDNTKAEQLVFKEYLLDGDIAKNSMFRQQLYNLMMDGTINRKKFESLSYNKNTLVKLFNEYNGNTGEKVNDHTLKQNRGDINLRITPGVSLTSLNISNNLSDNYYSFNSKVTYRIGAELEYILPFNNNKWSLFIDPNYQFYNSDEEKGNQKMKIEYTYINLPIGARHYMYLNEKSKFFIDAAYTLSFSLGDNYIQYSGSILDIQSNSTLSLGGGFSYDRYSIGIRHNFNHQIINYAYWNAKYSTTSIILGYKLF
ncbi:tRNA modification GTPase [Flavobacterium sp. NRK1]|uniref:tRNA modification GTPase n=1 Tax=Flavobacterium sp. NRK1 TaxID=2954929 RepID=UPI0020929C50|nr:tRNA modification GTPase [Flavobacterium sp. NRK1]MCO6148576.1 tRNA modification GTPase [Flavobacterium sp. NRK1]